MLMALVCLLTVLSAWAAWRKNPLFSLRATLRFIVSLGALVAAFVLFQLVAIAWADHLSQTAGLVVIFGATGLGTIAVLGLAIELSLPKATPLPAAARELNVFRKRTYVWARWLAWALLAFAVLELVLRGDAQIIVGTIGGLFAFLGVILMFSFYLTARRTDQWLSSVEAEPWAHWTYTPDQWRRWIEIEAKRATPDPAGLFQWRRDWRKAAPFFAIMLAVPLFFVGAPWTIRIVAIVVIAALIVIGVALANREKRLAPAALRKKLAQAGTDVYFGREGLFADGDFTPWLSPGVYLHAAYLDGGEPPSLTMQFLKTTSGYGAMQTMTMKVTLPLPEHGAVADLARLQRELSAKCNQANVKLA